MARPSKWWWLWISWLLELGLIELFAVRSRHPKPRTLTEHLSRWFPKRWRRVLLLSLLTALMWHFWVAPDVKPTYYRDMGGYDECMVSEDQCGW